MAKLLVIDFKICLYLEGELKFSFRVANEYLESVLKKSQSNKI